MDTHEAFSVLPPKGNGHPIFKAHVKGPPWPAFPFLCSGRTIDDASALRRHLKIHRVFHGTSKRRKKPDKEVIKRKDLREPEGLVGEDIALICRIVQVNTPNVYSKASCNITLYIEDRFGTRIRCTRWHSFPEGISTDEERYASADNAAKVYAKMLACPVIISPLLFQRDTFVKTADYCIAMKKNTIVTGLKPSTIARIRAPAWDGNNTFLAVSEDDLKLDKRIGVIGVLGKLKLAWEDGRTSSKRFEGTMRIYFSETNSFSSMPVQCWTEAKKPNMFGSNPELQLSKEVNVVMYFQLPMLKLNAHTKKKSLTLFTRGLCIKVANASWLKQSLLKASAAYEDYRRTGKTVRKYRKDLSINDAEAESIRLSKMVFFRTQFIFRTVDNSPVAQVCGATENGGDACNYSVLDNGTCSKQHVPGPPSYRYQLRAQIVDELFANSDSFYVIKLFNQCEQLFDMPVEEFKMQRVTLQKCMMNDLMGDDALEIEAPVFSGKFGIKGRKLCCHSIDFGAEDRSSQVPSQYASSFNPSQGSTQGSQ